MTRCRATRDGYYTDEHLDGCDGTGCLGCWPCVPTSPHGDPLDHCEARRSCAQHVEPGIQACPGCRAVVRRDLHEIVRLTGDMPAEAVTRGVDSEAAMLTGPAPDTADDIAAYGHRQSSIASGRLTGALEATGRHPLNVLGTWEQMLREDYQQPSGERMTVASVAAYLDGQLDRLAADPGQDFGEFARDVGTCRRHYEAVLRDHAQGDRAGVGCFDCGGDLHRPLRDTKGCDHPTPARRWLDILGTYPEVTPRAIEVQAAKAECEDCRGRGGFEDHWTCRDCRRRYTYAEYNFALRAALEGRSA